MSDAPAWLERLADRSLEDVNLREVGSLALRSGRLIACDPMTFLGDADAFALTLTAGTYRVQVGLRDGENAFAMVTLADRAPVRWEVARCPGEEDAEGWPGFGVDSGAGCFVDLEAARAWAAHDDALTERLEAKLIASGVDTSDPVAYHEAMEKERDGLGPDALDLVQVGLAEASAVLVSLNAETGANLVAFRAGGEGSVFASFWGYDAAGAPVALVTDLAVLSPPEEDEDAPLEDDFDGLGDLEELRSLLQADLASEPPEASPKLSGLELLAAALGAPEEPEPEVEQESPLLSQTRDLVSRWTSTEKIELEEDASVDGFVEALLEKLVSLSGYRNPGSHIAEWLCERPEVADVYASDEELEADLRRG